MQGSKREIREFDNTLYVGLTVAGSTVVGVNCTNAELEKLGITVKEGKDDTDYTSEKEGVKTVRIEFVFKEESTGYLFRKSFFLENTDRYSEDKDKYQYVNQIGDSAWLSDDDPNPTEFFANFKNKGELIGEKVYRKAKVGEADLMAFVKTWLDGFNYFDPTTDILLNIDNLFKGKYKELKEQVGGEYACPTIELLEVKTTDDGKQYQSVWKTSMKGEGMKAIRNVKFTPANIAKWKTQKELKKGWLSDYEQVAIDVTGEYGSKNYFELVPFKEYNPNANPVTSNEAKLPIDPVTSDY